MVCKMSLGLLDVADASCLEASAPATDYGPPPGITFDRFVRACVVVKNLTEAFQRVDTDRDGWVQISYQQFMVRLLRMNFKLLANLFTFQEICLAAP